MNIYIHIKTFIALMFYRSTKLSEYNEYLA